MSVRLSGCLIALIAMLALPSCGTDSTVASSSVDARDGAPTVAASSELVRHGRVVLPAGTTFAPGSLHVVNSLGSYALANDGSFDVVAYRGGPQFTLVTNDAGDPVLAGFVGPTQTRIDTTSTAKLLLFFAAGYYALPQPYRGHTIDALAMQPGFAHVVQTLETTLHADATALGRPVDSGDSFASAIDRFVATCHATRSKLATGATARRIVRLASMTSRRGAMQHLMRTFLVPLVGAVLVPIDSPAIDAMANVDTSRVPVAKLADLVLRKVPAISTFVDEGRTGDALLAAYTSIVDSDTAQHALFAMVRDAHAGRADGKALYDTASSMFATWNVLGSAFTAVPAAVVSDRIAPTR